MVQGGQRKVVNPPRGECGTEHLNGQVVGVCCSIWKRGSPYSHLYGMIVSWLVGWLVGWGMYPSHMYGISCINASMLSKTILMIMRTSKSMNGLIGRYRGEKAKQVFLGERLDGMNGRTRHTIPMAT